MKKKMFLILLVIFFIVSQSGNVGAAVNFKDIPPGYDEQVQDLVAKGIISGYADNTFRPNEVVTRGQFAAFVSRALKLEKNTINFKDVPATMSLKAEIGKAATAGIIKGFADGSFKPNSPVTRADIAVMLDGAMQLKGNYKMTVELYYADKGSITGYALESIKRMSAYGVMWATSSANRFEPRAYGTRITTVSAIYNMLKVVAGSDLTMTAAQLTQKYGEHKVMYRHRVYHKILEFNMINSYIDIRKYTKESFPEYVESQKLTFRVNYYSEYPNYEVVSYKGKSYGNSKLFTGYKDDWDKFMFDTVYPKNPINQNEFLLDIHLNSTDQGVYLKDNVYIKKAVNTPYYINGDFMVEIETYLNGRIQMTRSGSKLSLNNSGNTLELINGSSSAILNGKTVTLKNPPALKNDKMMVPIREIAKLLGLQTQIFQGFNVLSHHTVNRINVSNFPLGEDYKLN